MEKKKKLLIFAGSGIIIYLLFAIYLVPAFHGAGGAKEKFLKQLSFALGGKNAVAGENAASMAIFPYPNFTIKNIQIKNGEGFAAENFIEAPSLKIKPSFVSLLYFSMNASDYIFDDATINIEFGKGGQPNILPQKSNEVLNGEGLALGANLIFNSGRINHIKKQEEDEKEEPNPAIIQVQTAPEETLIKDLVLSISSSPEIKGTIISKGAEINISGHLFDLDLTKKTAKAKLKLNYLDVEFSFEGALEGFDQKMKMTGKYEALVSKPFETFTENYFARQFVQKDKILEKKLEVKGDISISLTDINSKNSEVKIGDWVGGGEINGIFSKGRSDINFSANFKSINLSDLLKAPEPGGEEFSTEAPRELQATESTQSASSQEGSATTPVQNAQLSELAMRPKEKKYSAILPTNITFNAKITADEIIYIDKKFNNVSLIFGIENNIAGIRNFSLPLPGNGVFSLNSDFSETATLTGTEARVDGQFSLITDNFSASYAPFSNFFPKLSEVKVASVSASADFAIMPGRVYITKIDSNIEDSEVKGEILFDKIKKNYEIKLKGNKFDYEKFSNVLDYKTLVDYAVKAPPEAEENLNFFDKLRMINYVFKGEFSFKDTKIKNLVYDELAFNVDIFAGNFILKDIKAISSGTSLNSGNFFLNTIRLKPKVVSDLKFKRIDLSPLVFNEEFFKNRKKEDPLPESIWNLNAFNFAGIELFDAKFNINSDEIKLGKVVFDNAILEGEITDRLIKINNFKSGFYGGTADLRFSLFTAGNISASLSYTIANVNIDELQKKFFNPEQTLAGKLSLTGTTQFMGGNFFDWVSGFSGTGSAIVKGMEIGKTNLLYLANKTEKVKTLEEFEEMIKRAFSEGKTKFDDFKGEFTIEAGIAELKNAKISSGTKIQIGDLRNIVDDGNLNFSFDLKNTELKSRTRINLNSRNSAPFELFLNFNGAFNSYDSRWDTSRLKKAWEDRILFEIQERGGGT